MPGISLGPGTNLAPFFNDVSAPYPGQGNFYNALRYQFMPELFGPMGNAAGNLAAAQASDQAAAGYYGNAPLLDPGSGAAQAYAAGQFGNLLTGEAAARNAQAAANAQTKSTAGSGIENTAAAYGGDIANTLAAETKLKDAQAAQSGGLLSDIFGGLKLAGGLASEIAAPGNPFGFSAIASGAGGLAGGGGGTPNLPLGFSTGASSFSPNTLPAGIDPSQIAAYGPEQGSFMDWLSRAGSWL